jgi:hypothetical protein
MTLTASELDAERSRGRIAGVATVVAGVLVAAGLVWGGLVNRDRPDKGDAARLRYFDHHAGALIGSSVVRAIGFLLLIFAVIHLYRATKGRKPEIASVQLVVGIAGAIAFAIGSIGQAVALANEAADFVTQHFQTTQAANDAANDVATEPWPLGMSVTAFAGTIALSFWFVIASLNAMRIGLLTRFMGVLGIIVGPGFIFGFAPPVMVIWLIALGLLFLGFSPRGLPPAWRDGDAIPWPKPGEDAPAEAKQIDGSRNGEVEPVGPAVRKPEAPQDEGQPAGDVTRRKRKRRR